MSTDTEMRRGAAPVGQSRHLPHGVVTAAIALVYLAAGVVTYLTVWTHGWNHWMLYSGSFDPGASSWYLAWIPYALLHGRSLWFTTRLNAPHGVNLAWNTATPFLGFILSPVTQFVGPIAADNTAMTMAPVAAALTMYVAALRLGAWWPASGAAGLLYGFSPYMVGQGYVHLNLVTVFAFPLIAWRLHHSLGRERQRPVRNGLILAGLLCAQFFTSTELLADAAILSVVGFAVYVVSGRSHARRLLRALPTYLLAVVFTALVVAYPIWFQFTGPQRLQGVPGVSVVSSDLVGAIVPTSDQWLHATPWLAMANQAVPGGTLFENGTYLGVPLVVLLLTTLALTRLNRSAAFWALMAVAAFVLSLGPVLMVANRSTGIAMPMALLERSSLLANVLPVRFSVFTDLFASLALAQVLTRLWRSSHGTRVLRGASVALLVGVIAVPLLPAPDLYAMGPVPTPPYFLQQRGALAPVGQTVVVYPFVAYPLDQVMLWQAEAKMRFRLVGAWALVPPPGGIDAQYRPPPLLLQTPLYDYSTGEPAPPVTPAALLVYRADLASWGATRLVVTPAPGSAKAVALFTAITGHHPVWGGGIWVWSLPRIPAP